MQSSNRVHPMYLKQMGNLLQRQGEGEDKILAHINPEEAQQLGMQYGYDINPATGLPQFGFLRKLEKKMRPIVKTALPLVGAIGGNMFGGPMGGIIGGSMGGALSSKNHKLDHALAGAGIGAASSYLLPRIGSFFGVEPSSGMGNVLGMGTPSFGEQTGLKGMLGKLSGNSKEKSEIRKEMKHLTNREEDDSNSGGWLGRFTPKDAIDAALMGTSIVGLLGRRDRIPKEPSISEVMEKNRPNWGPEDQPRRMRALNRKYIPAPEGYRPGIDPEHRYYSEEESNPMPQYYAQGGHVTTGYIDGDSGGQDDNVNALLEPKSFVMNAMDVSLFGDGNTENGVKKLEEMDNYYSPSGFTRMEPYTGKLIKAKVSPGEYVVKRKTVEAIGKGNPDKGAKILQKGRLNLRKQKGVKKILPPKSKRISQYMK